MLAAATVLEVAVVAAVLRPLAAQRSRERAELALDRAARQIAGLYDPYDLRELGRVLHENRPADHDAFLLLSAWDGRLVSDRPVGPELRARLVPLLTAAGLARPPDRRDSLAPAEAIGDTIGADARLELLGHRPVTIEGSRFGEVVALGPPLRASLWALPETRTLALFLPFAVLAAGISGLLMVRIVVARLRALEQVAARVTQGELAARVETSGRDEIGRLEERFNLMTDRLATARARLERTDLQRRQLFADITHELATPLTSIRGYVETLLDPGVPTSSEERAKYLNDVLEEAKRLDLLTAELLELTRLEAGATPLEPVRLDWATLCRNAARRLAPRFAEARLALEWSGLEEGAWVHADGRRLEQLVDNLLGNALRYVPAGGTVRVSIIAAEGGVTGGLEEEAEARVSPERGRGDAPSPTTADRGPFWRLTVSDDGPGIPPADLPHVFERFYRAESVRAHGGTGLGLAIVREIVRLHGGAVRAESAVPRGASFIAELPAVT